MGRTIPLRQAAAEFELPAPIATAVAGVMAKPRSAERQHLADLAERLAANRREQAELREPQAAVDAARAALPGAEEALKSALLDEALGDGDASTLESLKARVRELRAASRGVDHSARLSELLAEQVMLADTNTLALDRAIRAEAEAIAAEYHEHGRKGAAAEAALRALGAWAMNHERVALALAIDVMRQPADDWAAGAIVNDAIKAKLGEHHTAWWALPDRLVTDPDATGPTLAEAIRDMPPRFIAARAEAA